MLKTIKKQLKNIKKKPGVYIFRDQENKIIYIGKAVNLYSRVKGYFLGYLCDNRHLVPKIRKETKKIEVIATDFELEAILLEAEMIRKYKPKYNIRQKDDKSFIYIYINFHDSVPVVSFVREKELIDKKIKLRKNDKIFGPFSIGREIRKLLSYFRKIIPFRDCSENKFNKYKKLNRGCQWYEIGRCDAPCIKNISIKDYRHKISQLSRLLNGKFRIIEREMIFEMKQLSKKSKFEEAAVIRDRIKNLWHIKEVSLLDAGEEIKNSKFISIEALDISNISGKEAVGSLVRAKIKNQKSKIKMTNKNLKFEFDKTGYRRFKIRAKNKPNDVGMMKEVIKRRLNHPEWKLPDVILIDGGRGQMNAVNQELRIKNQEIPVIAIAKGPTRKGENLFFSVNFDKKLKKALSQDKKVVKLIRDEAHRFAISYHRLLRKKKILDR